jgi:hypothetical protein
MKLKNLDRISERLAVIFQNHKWKWGYPLRIPTEKEIKSTIRMLMGDTEQYNSEYVETGRIRVERNEDIDEFKVYLEMN